MELSENTEIFLGPSNLHYGLETVFRQYIEAIVGLFFFSFYLFYEMVNLASVIPSIEGGNFQVLKFLTCLFFTLKT